MIQPYIIKKGDMVLQPCSLSTGKYEGSYLLKYKDDSKVLKERVPKIIDRSCRFLVVVIILRKKIRWELLA